MGEITPIDAGDGSVLVIGTNPNTDWVRAPFTRHFNPGPGSRPRRSGQRGLIMRNVSVVPDRHAGRGLDISFDPDPSLHFPTVELTNVVVSGRDDNNRTSVEAPIRIRNAWSVTMNNVFARGPMNQFVGVGVDLDHCIVVKAWGLQTFFSTIGIRTTGHCEGIKMFDPEVVMVDIALQLNGPTMGLKSIEFEWVGGHYNARKRGIQASNIDQIKVVGVTGYRHPAASTAQAWIGVDLNNCDRGKIIGNDWIDTLGPFQPNDHGLVTNNCRRIIAHGNDGQDMALALWDQTGETFQYWRNNIGTSRDGAGRDHVDR